MNIIEMIKIIREVRILLKHQSKIDLYIYSDIIADKKGVIEVDDQAESIVSFFFQNLNRSL
jgi:hypothetical protein